MASRAHRSRRVLGGREQHDPPAGAQQLGARLRPGVGDDGDPVAQDLRDGGARAPGCVGRPEHRDRADRVEVELHVAQDAEGEAHAGAVAPARHQHQARGARRLGTGVGEALQLHAGPHDLVVAGEDLRERPPAGLGGGDPQVDPRERPVHQRPQERHPDERLGAVEGGGRERRALWRRAASAGLGASGSCRCTTSKGVPGESGLEGEVEVEGPAQPSSGSRRQGAGDGHLEHLPGLRQERGGIARLGGPQPRAPGARCAPGRMPGRGPSRGARERASAAASAATWSAMSSRGGHAWGETTAMRRGPVISAGPAPGRRRRARPRRSGARRSSGSAPPGRPSSRPSRCPGCPGRGPPPTMTRRSGRPISPPLAALMPRPSARARV